MYTALENYIESLNGVPKNAIHVDFLDSYLSPGSQIFVHPSTGLVTTEKRMNQQEVMDFWSNKVFGSGDFLDYSASYPYAIGRMHYVINTIKKELEEFIDIGNLDIVDFATGEGVFLDVIKQTIPGARLRATEGSEINSAFLRLRGYDISNVGLGLGHKFYFDGANLGTLLWTLSCTLNPYKLLQDIHLALPEESYLVVAESSRVLVPFKKSLSEMFRKDRPADIHPHYFSATTLFSSLACAGFQTIYMNRFHDSDVLLCIAKKVTAPEHGTNLPIDDSNQVINFFELWHSLSRNEFTRYSSSIEEYWA